MRPLTSLFVMCLLGCGSSTAEPAEDAPAPVETAGASDTAAPAEDEMAEGAQCLAAPHPDDAERRRQELADRPASEQQRRATPLEEVAGWDDADLAIEITTRLTDEHGIGGIGAMTVPERNVWHVFRVDSALRGGGFNYFFMNYSGDCAVPTLRALRTLGLDEHARIYEQALAVFPEPPREERAARSEQMSQMPDARERWAELETAYAASSTDAAVAAYVRANLEAFADE